MANTDLIYTLIAIVVPLVELLGIMAAVHAIMNARTSQGAVAWAISLITFPWLALILYAILGLIFLTVFMFTSPNTTMGLITLIVRIIQNKN